jgi:hypothetical protein
VMVGVLAAQTGRQTGRRVVHEPGPLAGT